MSELLDKQVDAQKESLKKYFQSSCKLPQAHEKVCDENETKKNNVHVKMLLMEEGDYRERVYTHAMDINELQVDDC